MNISSKAIKINLLTIITMLCTASVEATSATKDELNDIHTEIASLAQDYDPVAREFWQTKLDSFAPCVDYDYAIKIREFINEYLQSKKSRTPLSEARENEIVKEGDKYANEAVQHKMAYTIHCLERLGLSCNDSEIARKFNYIKNSIIYPMERAWQSMTIHAYNEMKTCINNVFSEQDHHTKNKTERREKLKKQLLSKLREMENNDNKIIFAYARALRIALQDATADSIPELSVKKPMHLKAGINNQLKLAINRVKSQFKHPDNKIVHNTIKDLMQLPRQQEMLAILDHLHAIFMDNASDTKQSEHQLKELSIKRAEEKVLEVARLKAVVEDHKRKKVEDEEQKKAIAQELIDAEMQEKAEQAAAAKKIADKKKQAAEIKAGKAFEEKQKAAAEEKAAQQRRDEAAQRLKAEAEQAAAAQIAAAQNELEDERKAKAAEAKKRKTAKKEAKRRGDAAAQRPTAAPAIISEAEFPPLPTATLENKPAAEAPTSKDGTHASGTRTNEQTTPVSREEAERIANNRARFMRAAASQRAADKVYEAFIATPIHNGIKTVNAKGLRMQASVLELIDAREKAHASPGNESLRTQAGVAQAAYYRAYNEYVAECTKHGLRPA